MKQITKDTKISIDVERCTYKQRGLVVNRLMAITGYDVLVFGDFCEEAKKINLNYTRWKITYTSTGRMHNSKVISFKKFLRVANPYKGKRFYLDLQNEGEYKKFLKRAKRMGYKWWPLSSPLWDGPEPVVLWEDNSLVKGTGIDATKLTYAQFMNFELPEEKSIPKLTFQGHDVKVTANTIKVGCKIFDKDDVIQWLRLSDEVVGENISLAETYSFLHKNRAELGI